MSRRSSRNAVFLGDVKSTKFRRGADLMSPLDLKQLEQLFEKWKAKPWSKAREKALGELSQKIKSGKEHLSGVSKYCNNSKFRK